MTRCGVAVLFVFGCLGCDVSHTNVDVGPSSEDAQSIDAPVSSTCMWMTRPHGPTVCDGMGRTACSRWASATTMGSSLVASSTCDNMLGCAAADACPSIGTCTCGTEAACANGSICTAAPNEVTPRCVACAQADL